MWHGERHVRYRSLADGGLAFPMVKRRQGDNRPFDAKDIRCCHLEGIGRSCICGRSATTSRQVDVAGG